MNKIDRRLLKTRLLVYDIINTPSRTDYQYIVGSNPSGAFEGATPNSIAYYENEKWNFLPPQTDGLEVFCISSKALLRWNGSSWVSEMSFEIPKYMSHTFYHTLTQEEIDNQSFDISLFGDNPNYDYIYRYEALFLNGVLQRETKDFNFLSPHRVIFLENNNVKNHKKVTVVWGKNYEFDLGFNNLDIRAGDVVVLQLLVTYIPK